MTKHSAVGIAAARALGAAGALPFVAIALWLLFGQAPPWALAALLAYAAIILSFLGGIRWGRALQAPSAGEFAISVLPSLAAWVLLFVAPRYALPLLTLAFAAQYAVDGTRGAREAPPWFLQLRLALTLTVAASLLLAWWAITR